MSPLDHLFSNNRTWADEIKAREQDFFKRLAEQQSPRYLWIGCSDSRVPPTQLVGLKPGGLFVHRNIGNVVVHTDLNSLSVLEYAVDALEVEHVIICGHYGCGGVKAAAQDLKLGPIDNWLRHIQDVQHKHADHLARITDESERLRRLCELNVIEQVVNVCRTTVMQEAWARGQSVTVHSWIYGLADGLLHDLGMSPANSDELSEQYAAALAGTSEAPLASSSGSRST